MDIDDLRPQIEELGSSIDALEQALAPLTSTSLGTSAGKLPLLDKAKLYVLATYALESLLFSSLRVAGVDAKSHPVFAELARVKQYFAKIKAAEAEGPGRRAAPALDKEAAGRFIKHGLAGNQRHDAEREARVSRERAGAKRKLEDLAVGTHTRFDGAAKRIRAVEGHEGAHESAGESSTEQRTGGTSSKRGAKTTKPPAETDGQSDDASSSDGDGGVAVATAVRQGTGTHSSLDALAGSLQVESPGSVDSRKGKKRKKEKKHKEGKEKKKKRDS